MNTFKKIFALLMVLAMILSVAACGGKPATPEIADKTTVQNSDEITTGEEGETEDPSGTGDGTATETVVTTAVAGTVIDPTPPPNFSETFRPEISRTTNKNGNASADFVKSLNGFEMRWDEPWDGLGDPNSEGGKRGRGIQQLIKDRYGITISRSSKNAQNYNQYIATMLQAQDKEIGHIVHGQDIVFQGYLNLGNNKNPYMAKLNTAMEKSGVNFKDLWYDQTARKFFNIRNGQYGWVGNVSGGNDAILIYYNIDHLKAKGLEMPSSLQSKGQWTWAKLKEYATKLKTSTVMGLTAGGPEPFAKALIASSGTSLVGLNSKNEFITNIKSPTVLAALNTLYEWTAKDDVMQIQGDWTYGKTSFNSWKASMILAGGDLTMNTLSADWKGKLGVASFPSQKAGGKFINYSTIQWFNFIPVTHNDETLKAKILFTINEQLRQDYRYGAYASYLNNARFFGDKMNDPDQVLINELRGVIKNNKYEILMDYSSLTEENWSDASTTALINDVASGEMTAKQAVDTYVGALENWYKSTWAGNPISKN